MLDTIFSRGVVSIMGGFSVALVVGTIYLWGIISVYITSYFKIIDSPDLTKDQVSLVFPFMFIGQATAMPIGVKVMKKFNAKLCCSITSVILAIVMYSSSFITKFYTFALVYGMIGGFMIGFLYMVPVAHCYKYFPKQKGLVSGIIVAGSGFGTLFFSFIATYVINPNNSKPVNGYFTEEIANNVPNFIRLLSYLSLLFVGGGSFFLLDLLPGMDPYKQAHANDHPQEKKKSEMVALMDMQFEIPPDQNQEDTDNPFGTYYQHSGFVANMNDYGYGTSNSTLSRSSLGSFGVGTLNSNYAGVQKHKYQAPDTMKAKKHRAILQQAQNKDGHHPQNLNQCPRVRDAPTVMVFWILFACMMFGSNFGLMISSNYKYYAYYQDTLLKSNFVPTQANPAYIPLFQDKFLSTVGAVGALTNGLSRFVWAFLLDRFDFQCLYSGLLILNAFLAATMSMAVANPNTYLIYVVLVYFCYGGHLGMFPALATKIFGVRNGTQIYGLLFQAFASSNFIQYIFIKILKPMLGYVSLFYLQVIFSLVSLIIIRMAVLQQDWSQKIQQNNERKRLAAR